MNLSEHLNAMIKLSACLFGTIVHPKYIIKSLAFDMISSRD